MNNVETLNAAQAADVLFADTETILELARKGILPGAKIGKCWVFLRDDVLAYLRSRVEQDTMARRAEATSSLKALGVLFPTAGNSRRRPPPPLPGLPEAPVSERRQLKPQERR